jgi:putative Mn2+ efflux pump MntP
MRPDGTVLVTGHHRYRHQPGCYGCRRGLAFLEVNIVTTALLIGLATTIMATTGMLLGRFLGAAMGKWAEVMGGVVLIGIGCTILLEHLAVFA